MKPVIAEMETERTNPWVGYAKRYAPIAAVALLLVAGWAAGWFEQFSLSSLVRNREALAGFVEDNYLLAAAGFFLLYAALVAVSFPGASLLTIAGGLMFGGVAGGAISVLAATVGACVIFLIARTSFGDFLKDRAGPFVSRMVKGFEEDAFLYLLTIRFTPVFPFWVVNIVPALLNMRLVPYAAATFLGIIPGGLAYAYIGAGLGSVVAAQEEANPGCAAQGTCSIDPSSLVTTEIIIAMVGLAIISILPVIWRKAKAKQPKSS